MRGLGTRDKGALVPPTDGEKRRKVMILQESWGIYLSALTSCLDGMQIDRDVGMTAEEAVTRWVGTRLEMHQLRTESWRKIDFLHGWVFQMCHHPLTERACPVLIVAVIVSVRVGREEEKKRMGKLVSLWDFPVSHCRQ